MTEAGLKTAIQQELKGLSAEFDTFDYTNAINAAKRDTGWATYGTDFRETWMLQRIKRHLFSYLQTETAADFKYKTIHLDQPFKNYSKLIKDMDEAFKEVMEEEPHQFADVSAFEMFGTQVDSGFATAPQTGRDITYDEDQRIIITPNEDS